MCGQPVTESGRYAVVGLIPLASAAYAGLLWALKIEGREELRALLLAKFGGGNRPPGSQ